MTIFKRFAIGSRQIAVCIVLGLLIVNLARAEDVRPTGKRYFLIDIRESRHQKDGYGLLLYTVHLVDVSHAMVSSI